MIAKLAVFGNPIAHSRSPKIHAMFGEQTDIDLHYEKVLVPAGQFAELARRFLAEGTGFNVTLPYKGEAWAFVDEASNDANLAQAVNTISVNLAGQVRGDNTDGDGLVTDITQNLSWVITGKRVLVLGAGGAVSGVLGSLLSQAPASIQINNRTRTKAERLVARFNDERLSCVSTAQLESNYDLIINGTSAGLVGDNPALPALIVGQDSHCYDMIYGGPGTQPARTTFNTWCLSHANCDVADGLGMLVEQAALAFAIWFDRPVDTQPVITELRA